MEEIAATRTKFGANDQGGVLPVAKGLTVAVLICDKAKIHYHVQVFQPNLYGILNSNSELIYGDYLDSVCLFRAPFAVIRALGC